MNVNKRLGQLSREQLLRVINRLKHNVDDNTIAASIQYVLDNPGGSKKKQRPFDMDAFEQRHIALRFSYMGENMDGFARQNNTDETVERYLFQALRMTKMIKDISSCEYSRCGRTDKGVSAFGQVIGIRVRSNVPLGATFTDGKTIDDLIPGVSTTVKLPDGSEKEIEELDYCSALNRSLPPEIQMISWSPAPDNFNARFNCLYRTYRFFFLRKDLDLKKMQQAADRLVGIHDYRNFCRKDPSIEGNFIRRILSFKVNITPETQSEDPQNQMCQLEICGKAFLWHQVRCMARVLELVGRGEEDPDVVTTMLNVEETPSKPQYDMASYLPLVLYNCAFENIEVNYDSVVLRNVYKKLKVQHEEASIRTAILGCKLSGLEKMKVPRKLVLDMDLEPEQRNILSNMNSGEDHLLWKDVYPHVPHQKKKKQQLPLLKRLNEMKSPGRKHKQQKATDN